MTTTVTTTTATIATVATTTSTTATVTTTTTTITAAAVAAAVTATTTATTVTTTTLMCTYNNCRIDKVFLRKFIMLMSCVETSMVRQPLYNIHISDFVFMSQLEWRRSWCVIHGLR